MKKNYLEPTTETAPLLLSAGIMSGVIENDPAQSGGGSTPDRHGAPIHL